MFWRRQRPTRLADVAGAAYGAFLAQQLQDEANAKDSLERRGLAVITTSGTLVTLVFAFTTFLSGQHRVLAKAATGLVIFAVASFGVAVLVALLIQIPREHDLPTIASFKERITPER